VKIPISTVSTPELIDQITEVAGHLNAAIARWLALIAEFDRRRAWAEWGVKSCAHWLNWKCGIDLGAAREKLVRSYRRAQEGQELSREAAQQRNQLLWWFHEPDGSLTIRGRLPAEVGALFIKAMQAAEDAAPPKNASAETFLDERLTTGAGRVEVLGRMAENFLAAGQHELSGGDRQQIVVHVDSQTLKHDHDGCCELEHGPAIAAETARRLACDASLIAIIENEKGEPLNVGRKTRTIPPAIRRALNSRDRGCRFPACTIARYVDGHHIQHWAYGGETKLSNLVTLCRFHHRQVHEGRVVVQCLDDGAIRFTRPNGGTFDSSLPRAVVWSDMVAGQRIQITPHTAITGWTGEAFDIDHAVGCLMQSAGRVKNVSAETSAAQAG
jgi:uncharacterized protein DUF222/HNH endonuclease